MKVADAPSTSESASRDPSCTHLRDVALLDKGVGKSPHKDLDPRDVRQNTRLHAEMDGEVVGVVHTANSCDVAERRSICGDERGGSKGLRGAPARCVRFGVPRVENLAIRVDNERVRDGGDILSEMFDLLLCLHIVAIIKLVSVSGCRIRTEPFGSHLDKQAIFICLYHFLSLSRGKYPNDSDTIDAVVVLARI